MITTLCCLLPLMTLGQQTDVSTSADQKTLDQISWLADLYDRGIAYEGDSLYVSPEVNRLMSDADYRQALYPETYTWETTLQLLSQQELRKAFWYLINLYPENPQNKELVLKSILAYDSILEMDKVMVGVFYTYCFMDPEIGTVVDGQPEITRPDILEQKLRTVREMVGYILAYREQQAEKENR